MQVANVLHAGQERAR